MALSRGAFRHGNPLNKKAPPGSDVILHVQFDPKSAIAPAMVLLKWSLKEYAF
jgi:hypothetical protein